MVSSEEVNHSVVCVVGLGYVGFPLVEMFSKHISAVGFDVNSEKVARLQQEYPELDLTTDPLRIGEADVIIIAVPTPVKRSKEPDLSYVISAATLVGQHLKKDAIVVLESTVYPGVTEEVVVPVLEQQSHLVCGKDFSVGYSPERVNPGDSQHTIDKITKVVSGLDEQTTQKLSQLYGLITRVYEAKDIRTAEAAKVIENIQRDLNIALMNELSLIFHRMHIDTNAVLEAASTKWNFNSYHPGLVGGHCIPVDPYYLVYKAKELGYHPQVILAGRSINDSMPGFVATQVIKALNDAGKTVNGSKVLIMGLTFKENVEDTRETPVVEMIKQLQQYRCVVYGFDPFLQEQDISDFGILPFDESMKGIDCVIVTVAHDQFKSFSLDRIKSFMGERPILFDVRGMFSREQAEAQGFRYLTL